MSPREIAYTRQVTRIWCAFLIFNFCAALGTVWYGSLEVWTLWNGLLSYLCMGLLFGGEYLYRIKVVKK